MKQHAYGWALVVVAACGGSPHTTEHDVDAGTDAIASDTTPPRVVSTAPVAGATMVEIYAPITVTFDEPLDPTTVTPKSFELTVATYPTPLDVDVTYDAAARTVRLHPIRALGHGLVYRVKISTSVTDVAGNTFGGEQFKFAPIVNGLTRIVTRDPSNNAITGWTRYRWNATGYALVQYTASGPDGVWLSADDAASTHYEYTYAQGSADAVRFLGPGTDNVFDTADDVVQGLSRYEYDGDGRSSGTSYFFQAGADGVWGTSDDLLNQYTTVTWDAADHLRQSKTVLGRGVDGQWRTPDDGVSTFTTNTFDAAGDPTRTVEANAGLDGLAETSDDVVSSYTLTTYDSNHAIATRTSYSGPGVDLVWFTADDVIQFAQRFDLAGQRLWAGAYQFSSAGADGIWRTADDVVSAHSTFTWNGHGQNTSLTTFAAPGGDGAWDTADDVISSYTTTTYDVTGRTTDYRVVSGPGTDGTWHTADDRVTGDYDYNLTN